MLLLIALASVLPLLSSAASSSFSACQNPKTQGSRLEGCPPNTLFVSQTDPQSQYGSTNAALATFSSQFILIDAGSYHEVIKITRKGPLTLLGVTQGPGNFKNNLVQIWNSSFVNQTTQTTAQDNADASVLTISPNRNASLVGSGPTGAPFQPEFGSIDFKAYNIDVANRAALAQTGPAAALMVSYANASFYGCTSSSYQDTLYVGRNGSAYFNGGQVKGSTDFIYGFGTAWFEEVSLASRGTGGGLVAWKGSTQWYGPNTFGAYFHKAKIIEADDVVPGVDLTHTRALGRPWNNQSRVIYLDSQMSDIVLPAGFLEWSASDPRVFPNITFFAEYSSSGPGWNASARNTSAETILTEAQASKYSIETVFGEAKPKWIDFDTTV
ncbi:carbohydrate esterase family 8 protein [Mrakia frigida]|uniref:carbohydrate esterase family 8 protein n=1 Tax=Mrakia frigida TaxID=29902 RepID=UPI003FCC1A4D